MGIITGAILDDVPGAGNGTEQEVIIVIAELCLIVVLFHDASTIQFRELYVSLPSRLLAIGLPITLLSLYYTVRALLPDIGVNGALLVAAALTPTDAGLGAPTILNPKVPSRVRQALNVESGINDGLITPIVFIAISGLVEKEEGGGTPDIANVALVPIAIAIALAAGIAPVFAFVMDRTAKHKWSTHAGRSISLVMFPLAMWSISILTGANGFIAAFLAGAVFGLLSEQHHKDHALAETIESVADFLSYCAWFYAGELLIFEFKNGVSWEWFVIAFLALVPYRMIPVALSLVGSGVDLSTMAFVGWFGPRGLATVIFALIAVEEIEKADDSSHTSSSSHEDDEEKLVHNIVGPLLLTVLFSVFAHGYSASPLSESYSAYMAERHAKLVASHKEKGGTGAPPAHLDLNPDIKLRGRGQAHAISKALRAVPSMNMQRYVGDFQDHNTSLQNMSHSMSADQLEDLANESGVGLDTILEEGEDAIIHMPYTKTANTTVIKKGSVLGFHHDMEPILEGTTSQENLLEDDSIKFNPAEDTIMEENELMDKL
eukprot:CAMPEP_0174967372 /NCGR_PEP_ID=MMETSP0004_2-20121128/7550_1 /TAXON_ID=420556 /ORGANISM="Ochromonas sp., Strain CCMP1393" /LENGTH=545 /DNA_ID=CAMNT_0016216503 /DNA_START=358 /DNA_END=1995 /DNA_ORIENTATION=-